MDPLVPNLYIMSPYYYELGLILCRLIGNPPLSAINAASSSSSSLSSSSSAQAAALMNSNSSIHANSRINTSKRKARNDSNDNNV